MPLYLFYTMVQKSQKWPKTQIKGGPALSCFVSLAFCTRLYIKLASFRQLSSFSSLYLNTVIHFYFGADLISIISVPAFFTEIKALPKF